MESITHHPVPPAAIPDEPRDSQDGPEPASACTGCRRRKLKCSKEVPKCQQCRKTGVGCVYDNKRNKSGMKAGAIEGLHRRLDALEKRLEESEGRTELSRGSQSPNNTPTGRNAPDPYSILSSLAKELSRFNDAPRHACVQGTQGSPGATAQVQYPPFKRRRVDIVDDIRNCHYQPPVCIETWGIPDERTLDALFKAYFSHVHPWIPMIHEGRLRKRLTGAFAATLEQQQRLRMLLAAIRLTGARFINDRELASCCAEITDEGQSQARDWVILEAMKRPSVESLQALIILAFHDIGAGEDSLAWPIIGSLTRTAEYLQLTVEHGIFDRQSQPLVQPYTLLAPAQDWTQEEERRRVFWTIFNLDRYCSVTMGWNTSLTSHDVNRRLPCDGITWRKEDPVETPFFGIWDKAAGRIGNPIAFLPSHSAPSPQHHRHLEDAAPATPSVAGSTPGESYSSPSNANIDMSAVGAFAYSIEATESLSRVNTYFLQQRGVRDRRDVHSWLTRFKELDLRLVHWKMFLPRKWKADNVTARPASRMDPNLTLAHVTHNASMILLHQVVAFPLPEWDFFKNQLPSALSVDTCQAAAVEIEVMARNFLKCTEGRVGEESMPLSSQFTFCVYIAARYLLVHWRGRAFPGASDDRALAPEFQTLLQILYDIAKRWAGPHGLGSRGNASLAAKYAQQLNSLYRRCVEDAEYYIDPLGYTTEMDHIAPGPVHVNGVPGEGFNEGLDESSTEGGDGHEPAQETVATDQAHKSGLVQQQHYQQSQQVPPPAEMAQATPLEYTRIQESYPSQNIPHAINNTAGGPALIPYATPHSPETSRAYPREIHHQGGPETGEATMISQMLMNQQFLDLDRVISYDEGMFGSEFDRGTW